jgi:hypothetical protein
MHFFEGVIMANFTDPARVKALDLSHDPGYSRNAVPTEIIQYWNHRPAFFFIGAGVGATIG